MVILNCRIQIPGCRHRNLLGWLSAMMSMMDTGAVRCVFLECVAFIGYKKKITLN